mmetsp:Transcript_1691/g.3424  ORF Transcript_1691/g.3424 Transcript_1691/m.3424 type:complete len:84 (-) Transcript_1691:20-271(-)|eukprot:5289470-Pleurochrysis_carterae.AAC.2
MRSFSTEKLQPRYGSFDFSLHKALSRNLSCSAFVSSVTVVAAVVLAVAVFGVLRTRAATLLQQVVQDEGGVQREELHAGVRAL